MSAYKQLTLQDFYLSDYLAKKRWFASGSYLSDYNVETLRGFSGSTPGYPYPNDLRNNRYQKLVFDSATHNFYKLSSGSISGSTIFSGSYDIDPQTTLDLSGSRIINKEVGIISIPKDVVGIGIEPGSFMIEPTFEDQDKYVEDGHVINKSDGRNDFIENIQYWYNSNPYDNRDYLVEESNYVDESTEEYLDVSKDQQRWEIIDDGEGKLFRNGERIGDIIYQHGLAIITNVAEGVYSYSRYGIGVYGDELGDIISGSNVNCSFQSTMTIYESQYKCTSLANEFNQTQNPSAISGSTNSGVIYDFLTGSYFQPYVTTVGLYNNANQLVAVGKLSQPLQNSNVTDTTVLVNLDL